MIFGRVAIFAQDVSNKCDDRPVDLSNTGCQTVRLGGRERRACSELFKFTSCLLRRRYLEPRTAIYDQGQPRAAPVWHLLVAERGPGNLVGCGGWTTAQPGNGEIIEGEAHIRQFATHPEWVGRGVGSSLLARCFREARTLGICKLHCLSTLNAERFYRACGFETIGPIGVPMGQNLTFPCVLMSRDLA